VGTRRKFKYSETYYLSGCGTQTAALAIGGETTVEVSKAQKNIMVLLGHLILQDLGTVDNVWAGAGTQTAGLAFGGSTTVRVANTEEYDGSTWTAGGNLNTTRNFLAGAGTQTAGLAFWW
jgi:hypothetical protein